MTLLRSTSNQLSFLTTATVQIGSQEHGVMLSRNIFQKVKVSSRDPAGFTFRLIDALFDDKVLANSTISGTKDRPALDKGKIDAIKGILYTRLYYY